MKNLKKKEKEKKKKERVGFGQGRHLLDRFGVAEPPQGRKKK
jgi:hypothetical protein